MNQDPNTWQPSVPPPPPSVAVDPYAPPRADVTPRAGGVNNAEQIRRQFLNHEASIRSFGFLYLLNGWVGLAGTAMIILFLAFAAVSEGFSDIGAIGMMFLLVLFLGAISYFTLFLGRGMRALDPKVKTGVTILAGFGLLGFPLGTIINGYILYLIHGEKGKRVMSAEYQSVVAQTPHIEYKMPLIVKVFLALILAVIVSATVMVLIGV